jgi:hypothetical protein
MKGDADPPLLPWHDPDATGILSMPSAHDVEVRVSALFHGSHLLGRNLTNVLLAFAERHTLEPERKDIPEKSGGGEGWTLAVYTDRLERLIQVKIATHHSHLGRRIAVRTLAQWCVIARDSEELTRWETNYEPRAYGLTTMTPPSAFDEILELALQDALSYTVDDLEPLPIGTPGRPTGLPWAWNL